MICGLVLSSDPYLKKWQQRHAQAEDNGSAPAVLTDNLYLLPTRGKALDLACGRGAGALQLAQQGLTVSAWDFSSVAIERLQNTAEKNALDITASVRDIVADPPMPDSFDVILLSYFLDRTLMPKVLAAVRPGGLLLYETFTQTSVSDRGPSSSDWRLQDNELLHYCKGWQIHYYRENGRLGNTELGVRDVAMIVAAKPQQQNK